MPKKEKHLDNVKTVFNMKKLSAIILFGCLVFTSCKYDEGPIISFRTYEKRISGNWEIEYAAVSGTEVTLPINKSINLESGYVFSNSSPIVSKASGIWSLNSNFTSVMFYKDITLDSLYTEYKILKLRNKMLWLKNDTYEYHLKSLD
jgi:hypothetical protein